MKALILAGGRGNRINEFSENQNKCMIQFRNKPLIEHLLDQAAAIDFSEIVIVVGYKAEEIINHYGISFKKKRIRYVIQPEQRGLVHAIECARNALSGEDFFLMLGDEVMAEPKRKNMVDFFQGDKSLFGVCGVLKVNDLDQIRRTYAVVKDDQEQIFRLIEKPKRPINEFQGTGHCIFRNRILEYIDVTPIHHERGEKELPDLIQCCIDDGKNVKAFLICKEYSNINSKEDLLKAEGYY
jgi:dTDP-glucose pyrophosphorylase